MAINVDFYFTVTIHSVLANLAAVSSILVFGVILSQSPGANVMVCSLFNTESVQIGSDEIQ